MQRPWHVGPDGCALSSLACIDQALLKKKHPGLFILTWLSSRTHWDAHGKWEDISLHAQGLALWGPVAEFSEVPAPPGKTVFVVPPTFRRLAAIKWVSSWMFFNPIWCWWIFQCLYELPLRTHLQEAGKSSASLSLFGGAAAWGALTKACVSTKNWWPDELAVRHFESTKDSAGSWSGFQDRAAVRVKG